MNRQGVKANSRGLFQYSIQHLSRGTGQTSVSVAMNGNRRL
jgi:hypothetical protein